WARMVERGEQRVREVAAARVEELRGQARARDGLIRSERPPRIEDLRERLADLADALLVAEPHPHHRDLREGGAPGRARPRQELDRLEPRPLRVRVAPAPAVRRGRDRPEPPRRLAAPPQRTD